MDFIAECQSLRNNKFEQMRRFKEMLRKLEDKGLCLSDYHELAYVLFDDDME